MVARGSAEPLQHGYRVGVAARRGLLEPPPRLLEVIPAVGDVTEVHGGQQPQIAAERNGLRHLQLGLVSGHLFGRRLGDPAQPVSGLGQFAPADEHHGEFVGSDQTTGRRGLPQVPLGEPIVAFIQQQLRQAVRGLRIAAVRRPGVPLLGPGQVALLGKQRAEPGGGVGVAGCGRGPPQVAGSGAVAASGQQAAQAGGRPRRSTRGRGAVGALGAGGVPARLAQLAQHQRTVDAAGCRGPAGQLLGGRALALLLVPPAEVDQSRYVAGVGGLPQPPLRLRHRPADPEQAAQAVGDRRAGDNGKGPAGVRLPETLLGLRKRTLLPAHQPETVLRHRRGGWVAGARTGPEGGLRDGRVALVEGGDADAPGIVGGHLPQQPLPRRVRYRRRAAFALHPVDEVVEYPVAAVPAGQQRAGGPHRCGGPGQAGGERLRRDRYRARRAEVAGAEVTQHLLVHRPDQPGPAAVDGGGDDGRAHRRDVAGPAVPPAVPKLRGGREELGQPDPVSRGVQGQADARIVPRGRYRPPSLGWGQFVPPQPDQLCRVEQAAGRAQLAGASGADRPVRDQLVVGTGAHGREHHDLVSQRAGEALHQLHGYAVDAEVPLQIVQPYHGPEQHDAGIRQPQQR